jgi:hypothetical protein
MIVEVKSNTPKIVEVRFNTPNDRTSRTTLKSENRLRLSNLVFELFAIKKRVKQGIP